MKFLPIVPTGNLSLLDEFDGLFVLPNSIRDKRFFDYIVQRSWNLVVIDNDYYEAGQCCNFESECKIAKLLDAQEVYCIGPETLDGLQTLELCKPYKDSELLMVILKPVTYDVKTTQELMQGMVELFGKYCDLFPNWCLISKCTEHEREQVIKDVPTAIIQWHDIRTELAKQIRHDAEFIHCLGCDSIDELAELHYTGVDSCDSSFPCSRAAFFTSMKAGAKSSRILLEHHYDRLAETRMRNALQAVKQILSLTGGD